MRTLEGPIQEDLKNLDRKFTRIITTLALLVLVSAWLSGSRWHTHDMQHTHDRAEP